MLQVESSDEIWHLLSHNTVSELSVCSRAYAYLHPTTYRQNTRYVASVSPMKSTTQGEDKGDKKYVEVEHLFWSVLQSFLVD